MKTRKIIAIMLCGMTLLASCNKKNEPSNENNSGQQEQIDPTPDPTPDPKPDPKPDPEPIPAYVDLGLSVKWATCNLGASTPQSSGKYYAWGEINTKSTFSWGTYEFGSDYANLSKYNTTDGLTVLDSNNDVARQTLGEGWRMPTNDEIDELFDNCDEEFVKESGVYCMKYTASNGNSILIPAKSYKTDGNLVNATIGGFWTANRNTTTEALAYTFSFAYTPGDMDDYWASLNENRSRKDGWPVRAVYTGE